MNHFTEDQIVAIFGEFGYNCRVRRTWQSQRLFLFARGGEPPAALSPRAP